jgi:hypothetical protein
MPILRLGIILQLGPGSIGPRKGNIVHGGNFMPAKKKAKKKKKH